MTVRLYTVELVVIHTGERVNRRCLAQHEMNIATVVAIHSSLFTDVAIGDIRVFRLLYMSELSQLASAKKNC
jgi:hypothetical protein